jgi:hypothetical protein
MQAALSLCAWRSVMIFFGFGEPRQISCFMFFQAEANRFAAALFP